MKILLGSHGHLASGMQSSLRILMGDEADKLTVLDAYVGDDDVEASIKAFFEGVPEGEEVLMMSDLYGGSVNQKMYLYLDRPNTYLIAGVNLAVVIELCLKDHIDDGVIEETLAQARSLMCQVKLDTAEIVEDEDFL